MLRPKRGLARGLRGETVTKNNQVYERGGKEKVIATIVHYFNSDQTTVDVVSVAYKTIQFS